MLSPKRIKHRKSHRGRLKGKAFRGNEISFGTLRFQALEPGWITSRQIEAGRRVMTRYASTGGQSINFEKPYFTISHTLTPLYAKVIQLDPVLGTGINEHETVKHFVGKQPTILLGESGYHELLLNEELLAVIESFDDIAVLKQFTSLPFGNNENFQKHDLFFAVKSKNLTGCVSSGTTLELKPGGTVELPKDLVVFSFNYLGSSYKNCVRCSISGFPTFALGNMFIKGVRG